MLIRYCTIALDISHHTGAACPSITTAAAVDDDDGDGDGTLVLTTAVVTAAVATDTGERYCLSCNSWRVCGGGGGGSR
jgi:hypothetical protein